MAYMYAHFVFHWYAGESTVRIFHGEIGGRNLMPLVWTLNIDSEWDRITLAERGKQWVRDHLARFKKK